MNLNFLRWIDEVFGPIFVCLFFIVVVVGPAARVGCNEKASPGVREGYTVAEPGATEGVWVLESEADGP